MLECSLVVNLMIQFLLEELQSSLVILYDLAPSLNCNYAVILLVDGSLRFLPFHNAILGVTADIIGNHPECPPDMIMPETFVGDDRERIVLDLIDLALAYFYPRCL